MKKIKVLLFARDPGGANTIIPLYDALKRRRYRVILFGKDYALKHYAIHGLKSKDIMKEIAVSSPVEIKHFLTDIDPDIIITGTSADDMTERYMWEKARELNKPSVAIIDSWLNYGIRFSKYRLDELIKYEEDHDRSFVPNKIFIMDRYSKNEMLKEGFSGSQVNVTGQPYFERLRNDYNKITGKEIARAKKTLGIKQRDFVIIFAAEPLSKLYPNRGVGYLGYNERTILTHLLSTLEKLQNESQRRIILIVRPHPKQSRIEFSGIINKYKNKVKIIMPKELYSNIAISLSDVVVGMASMFLVESAIVGKTILSIQIGLKRKDPFILSRQGAIKSITKKELLIKTLRAIIVDGKVPKSRFKVIPNPVERIVSSVEEVLCQN